MNFCIGALPPFLISKVSRNVLEDVKDIAERMLNQCMNAPLSDPPPPGSYPQLNVLRNQQQK